MTSELLPGEMQRPALGHPSLATQDLIGAAGLPRSTPSRRGHPLRLIQHIAALFPATRYPSKLVMRYTDPGQHAGGGVGARFRLSLTTPL